MQNSVCLRVTATVENGGVVRLPLPFVRFIPKWLPRDTSHWHLNSLCCTPPLRCLARASSWEVEWRPTRDMGRPRDAPTGRALALYSRLTSNRREAVTELDRRLEERMAALQAQHRVLVGEVAAAFERKATLLRVHLETALGTTTIASAGAGEEEEEGEGEGEGDGHVAAAPNRRGDASQAPAPAPPLRHDWTCDLEATPMLAVLGDDSDSEESDQPPHSDLGGAQPSGWKRGRVTRTKCPALGPPLAVDVSLRVGCSTDPDPDLGAVLTKAVDVSKCSAHWDVDGGLTAVVSVGQQEEGTVPLQASDCRVAVTFAPALGPGPGPGSPPAGPSSGGRAPTAIHKSTLVTPSEVLVRVEAPRGVDGVLRVAVTICGVTTLGTRLRRRCFGGRVAQSPRTALLTVPLDSSQLLHSAPVPASFAVETGQRNGWGLAVCPLLGLMALPCQQCDQVWMAPLPDLARVSTKSVSTHLSVLSPDGHTDGRGVTPRAGLEILPVTGWWLPLRFNFVVPHGKVYSNKDDPYFCRETGSGTGYLAFAGPASARLLLVPDWFNDSVRAIDIQSQKLVGFVGSPGTIGGPRAVAATGPFVAISAWKVLPEGVGDPIVHVYRHCSHADHVYETWTRVWAVHSSLRFGGFGPGCFMGLHDKEWRPSAVAFTADASGLVVAGGGCLSLFSTVDGTFVQHLRKGCITVGQVAEYEGGWLVGGRRQLGVVPFSSQAAPRAGGHMHYVNLVAHSGAGTSATSVGTERGVAAVPGLGLLVREEGHLVHFESPVFCIE